MKSGNARTGLAEVGPDPARAAVWAVVPVKLLSKAKQRLHSCLGDNREDFTLAMLEDVVSATAESLLIEHVVCVTADPAVKLIAERHGAMVIDEGPLRGMNGAVRLGIEKARSQGAGGVVVLPADIPLASGGEIDRLLNAVQSETGPEPREIVGLNSDAGGRGTNFLYLEIEGDFETQYGRDSYRQHQACARAEGYRSVLLSSRTLSLDVDSERDLQDLISYYARHPDFQRTKSWINLRRIGLVGAPVS